MWIQFIRTRNGKGVLERNPQSLKTKFINLKVHTYTEVESSTRSEWFLNSFCLNFTKLNRIKSDQKSNRNTNFQNSFVWFISFAIFFKSWKVVNFSNSSEENQNEAIPSGSYTVISSEISNEKKKITWSVNRLKDGEEK